jgi:hypothetical protein
MSQPTNRSRDSARKRGPTKPGPDPKAHPLAGPRPPAYVIVLWVNQELRQRIQRNNAALAQDLQDRDNRRHGREAGPKSEPEAEP